MTKFEQAIEAGYTEEEIRDRILERDSDKIAEAVEAGYTEEEIFSKYEESLGLPKHLILGASDTSAEEVTEPEKTKEDLISDEFELKRSQINKAKETILSLNTLSDDDKERRVAQYDLMLNNIEQDKLDSIAKYQKEKAQIDKTKRDMELKDETGVIERFDIGLGEFQGQFRVNTVAPIAEWFEDKGIVDKGTAEEIKTEGTAQIEKSREVASKFKELYGEDAWNIAQEAGNLTPNVIASIAAGARSVAQAGFEGVTETMRTGSVVEGGKAAAIAFLGGKLADTLFSVGAKQVKTTFGKEIDAMPLDKKRAIDNTLDILEENNIDVLDENTRRKILEKIDFGADTATISKQVVDELSTLKDTSYKIAKEAYDKADEIAKTSGKLQISNSEFITELTEKNIKLGEKTLGARKKIAKIFADEGNAFDIEVKIQDLGDMYSKAKGTSRKVYKEAIDYAKKKQSELVGDTYQEARDLYSKHMKEFEGGSKVGRRISKVLSEKDQTAYNVASELMGKKATPKTAKQLSDLGLTQDVKTKMAKDIITEGLDIEKLDTAEATKKIISKFRGSNQDGLKVLLGKKEYTSMTREIEALDTINKLLSEQDIDNKVGQDVVEFISDAFMVKISPVYAAKGMIYKGKKIASKVLFRKEAGKIQSRIKSIPDRTVANKTMKAFNAAMLGYSSTDLNSMFEEEQ